MRKQPNLRVEGYRLNETPLGKSPYGANHGLFQIGQLKVISSGNADDNPWSAGWEHVSVSCMDRIPTWVEMCKVKELFWRDDETVIQFHPRKDKYINQHPYTLHLWKRGDSEYELPPAELIG